MIDLLAFCQWPGLATGLIGAWFVSSKMAKHRYWGFFLWVLSDIFWSLFGLSNGGYGLIIMQLLFIITSTRGMLNSREPDKHS